MQYASGADQSIIDTLRSAGLMNPVTPIPIIIKDDPTAIPAIGMANAEGTLFVGNSQEAENGDHDTLMATTERQFITPDHDFTTMDQDGDTDSSQRYQPGMPRPAPNMLVANKTLPDFASPEEPSGGRKRKRADQGPANATPVTKAMKRRKNDIESLRAELAKLEHVRDEARLKHEAEQRRTEEEAVSVEHLL